MSRFPASRAREAFAEILNRVAYTGERIVLHRHGKNVAAIVSIADLARLETLEDAHDIQTAREAIAEPGASVSWDELKRELPR